jgi:hypothetical protein
MSSKQELEKQAAVKSPLTSLSSSVVTQLSGLMRDVTKDDKSPMAVRAACNCAKEIREILRLEFEARKWAGK